MRITLHWLLGIICIVGCGARHPGAPGQEAVKDQPAKVFYMGEGDDRDVKRFQKVLEIALDDYGMVRVDSRRDADATVQMQLKHYKETVNLYAPVLWIVFASRSGQEYMAKSCTSVSTSADVFTKRTTDIEPIQLPANWKKQHPQFAVYISDQGVKGFEDLLPTLKSRVAEDGYSIAGTRAESDGEVKSIRLQKLSVPMRTVRRSRPFEVFDRDSNRFYYTSKDGEGDLTYLGVMEGIKLENLPCRQTFETFGQDSQDGSWRVANRVAKTIQEHLKKTHSN